MGPIPDPHPRFSVVVPAHNEETVIRRCLAFVNDLLPGEAEIVVVANGCTDATAARARKIPGVRVLEHPMASKTAALNAGDAACSVFPRVYLDADITVSAEALRATIEALPASVPAVASPTMFVQVHGRTWLVRSFYRVFEKLPYARDGLIGLGFYAISAAGRARFGHFPEVTADDLFVSNLFTQDERIVIRGHWFTIEAPRDFRSLLDVRTRVSRGNTELIRDLPVDVNTRKVRSPSTASTVRSVAMLVFNEPRRLPDSGVYVLVTALARRRARGTTGSSWLTDRSTR